MMQILAPEKRCSEPPAQSPAVAGLERGGLICIDISKKCLLGTKKPAGADFWLISQGSHRESKAHRLTFSGILIYLPL